MKYFPIFFYVLCPGPVNISESSDVIEGSSCILRVKCRAPQGELKLPL